MSLGCPIILEGMLWLLLTSLSNTISAERSRIHMFTLCLQEPCVLFTTVHNIPLFMAAIKNWVTKIHLRTIRSISRQDMTSMEKTWQWANILPHHMQIFTWQTWEKREFQKCEKTTATTLLYLGDIWGIWIHSKEEFLDFVNNHQILIKVEPVTRETQINLLDTVVCQRL